MNVKQDTVLQNLALAMEAGYFLNYRKCKWLQDDVILISPPYLPFPLLVGLTPDIEDKITATIRSPPINSGT